MGLYRQKANLIFDQALTAKLKLTLYVNIYRYHYTVGHRSRFQRINMKNHAVC